MKYGTECRNFRSAVKQMSLLIATLAITSVEAFQLNLHMPQHNVYRSSSLSSQMQPRLSLRPNNIPSVSTTSRLFREDQYRSGRSGNLYMSMYADDKPNENSFWNTIASSISQTAAVKVNEPLNEEQDKAKVQLVTLLRVGIPSLVAGIVAVVTFPYLALSLASMMNDAGVFAVLSQDSSQFVQNFLTVTGLLFSILVGQSYSFMYQQQECIYYALFEEVTEAKSLLEQVALVCQGRSMYQNVLTSIYKYVSDDLKQLQKDPAVLLSSRPVDDPLEAVMYMTSVGVPGTVYETVRSLRQARARRLGALQRKLPSVHMLLLWILAAIELIAFPLLGAGTQTIGGYNILTVEGCLFGVMTFGIVMTLRVVGELWRPAGGAYNVDTVLAVMVRGLEEELEARLKGNVFSEGGRFPTEDNKVIPANKVNGVPKEFDSSPEDKMVVLSQQGAVPNTAFLLRIKDFLKKKLVRLRHRRSRKM